ncbi:MAG: PilZ domain-containing protein [Elusimicrobia bacterium]|nr:PilZ domain-containing protein [Elusimicrobiota bacterium]
MNKLRKTSEKRKHPRFPVGLTLELHAPGQLVSRGRGKIVDLSVGGMSFETNAELEESTSLYLRINVPLEIRGDVRHIRQTGHIHRYGVRFHKMGAVTADKSKPAHFIAAQFRKV